MTWTTTPPAAPGFYWLREPPERPGERTESVVVEVFAVYARSEPNRLAAWWVGVESPKYLDELPAGCLWSDDPVPEPAGPK